MGDEVEDWFPGVVVVAAVIIQRQVHNGRTKRDDGSRDGFFADEMNRKLSISAFLWANNMIII